jgi:hypothetical protein
MRSVYKRVRAKVYFFTAAEGGRSPDVDLRHPRYLYEVLADLGPGSRTRVGPMVRDYTGSLRQHSTSSGRETQGCLRFS